MCKESEKKSETKTEIPQYVEDAGKLLVSKATDVANKEFTPYTGDRFADFTPDQLSSFQKIRDLVANSPDVGTQAIKMLTDYANNPQQMVSTERIVDENGRLGALSDYFNPYVDNALQPAIRKIMESAAQQKKALGSSATSSGAFGDARHGIVESNLNQNTSTAIGDTATKFYSDAFDKAMAARSSDAQRFLTADTTMGQFGEQALGRKLSGANALVSDAQADQTRQLQVLQALLGSGNQQQGQQQLQKDFDFNEFMRQQGWDANVLGVLGSALAAAPYEKSQTTTETGDDNSLIGALGSVVGSVASSTPVATALATML